MEQLTKLIQARFDEMCKTQKLFRVKMTGRQVWDLYLKSFTNADDPIFRDPESTAHNCNNCNNFIRRYGNIVAIDADMNVISMFGILAEEGNEYTNSMLAMDKFIKNSPIADVFFETYNDLVSLPYEACKKNQTKFRLGMAKNHKRYTKEEAEQYGVVKAGEVKTFDHFHLDLPKRFVLMSNASIEAIQGIHRDNYNVFLRAMKEIPLDTLQLARDLIAQGSLLNGTTHLYKVDAMINYKQAFDALSADHQVKWCWLVSRDLPLAKFKNELIGVFCTELAEGKELNKTCKDWNIRVDPVNYMKAVAPITEMQKKLAREFVEENGYIGSFDRRLAIMSDIKTDEIKHINSGDGKLEEISIFDKVRTAPSTRHKRSEFKGIAEISIVKFMAEVLPGCSSVEVYLENTQANNMVTMTTSVNGSKPLFKWDNPYSWTYKGNLAGKSEIKEAVKSQGGNVEGVLRFSIMWSEGESQDNSDLDAHCKVPGSHEDIYFGHRVDRQTDGNLDIDITQPLDHKRNGRKVVENIAFPYANKLIDGVYKFFVRQFSARGSRGFTAELEFDGELHEYSYPQPVSGSIAVVDVKVTDGVMSIHKHHLVSSTVSKEIYGLKTHLFHKVNLMCLSPNHWGKNNVGNLHYFFMLDKCKLTEPISSFHSENLDAEVAKHRKVLEVLGATTMVEPSNNAQLSGLGFNATVKDAVILRLKGNFKRMVKVTF